jgi:hypothetical protein
LSVRLFGRRAFNILALLIVIFILAPCATMQPERPEPAEVPVVACRIVSIRSEGSLRAVHPLVDVSLDPATGTLADQVFEAVLHDGRKLGAKVQRVRSDLPRDRFNVTLFVDGRTHLRVNHIDLDIYIETSVDSHVYALHCFPEFDINGGAPSQP